MGKDSIIKNAFDLGFEHEKLYRGCSQCVISAVQAALEIRNDFVFKAGSGLATGIGLLGGGVCGGYSGGVMMMSLFFGRERNKIDNDREEKYCSYRMAIALHDKFIDKYGAMICRAIQKGIFGKSYNLWDADEKEAFEKAGAHRDKCTGVVAQAAAWTTELIIEEIEKRSLSIEDFKSLTFKC